jgi:hypothetical protein
VIDAKASADVEAAWEIIDALLTHIRRGIAVMVLKAFPLECPSSDDLRHIAGLQKGSGSSVIEIMRHAVDAASDGLRLSGA